jgi:Xaa-Pro aminopeptidase
MGKFTLDNNAISKNIDAVRAKLKSDGITAACVTSFDPYLNEYVPMSNCHRYYVSGFSGSVAEVLFLTDGKVKLYVDGRYHEQADNEVDAQHIEVVKVPQNKGIWSALMDDLATFKGQKIAIEESRFPVGRQEKLASDYSLVDVDLAPLLGTSGVDNLKPIYQEDNKLVGKAVDTKLDLICENDQHAHYVTALDSLAWVSNCRGYHLPFQSAFLGKGLATKQKLYVFIDSGVKVDTHDSTIEWIECSAADLEPKLSELQKELKLSVVEYDPNMLNAKDYGALKNVFGDSVLKSNTNGLIPFHSIKDDAEMQTMRASFKAGDKAIFETIKWVKETVESGEGVSELDLYNKTTEFYRAQGAKEQSFNTISGRDAQWFYYSLW